MRIIKAVNIFPVLFFLIVLINTSSTYASNNIEIEYEATEVLQDGEKVYNLEVTITGAIGKVDIALYKGLAIEENLITMKKNNSKSEFSFKSLEALSYTFLVRDSEENIKLITIDLRN